MEERRTSDIIVSINEELVKLHKEIIVRISAMTTQAFRR